MLYMYYCFISTNNTTPLHIVRYILKSNVYFSSYNGLFLNQKLNSIKYLESVVFKIALDMRSFAKVRNVGDKYIFVRDVIIVIDFSCKIRCHWSPVFVFQRTWTKCVYEILIWNVADLYFILTRCEVQWNIDVFSFCTVILTLAIANITADFKYVIDRWAYKQNSISTFFLVIIGLWYPVSKLCKRHSLMWWQGPPLQTKIYKFTINLPCLLWAVATHKNISNWYKVWHMELWYIRGVIKNFVDWCDEINS